MTSCETVEDNPARSHNAYQDQVGWNNGCSNIVKNYAQHIHLLLYAVWHPEDRSTEPWDKCGVQHAMKMSATCFSLTKLFILQQADPYILDWEYRSHSEWIGRYSPQVVQNCTHVLSYQYATMWRSYLKLIFLLSRPFIVHRLLSFSDINIVPIFRPRTSETKRPKNFWQLHMRHNSVWPISIQQRVFSSQKYKKISSNSVDYGLHSFSRGLHEACVQVHDQK